MKRVIKVSKAWIAAFIIGIVLTGCGGGGSSSGSDSQAASGTVGSSGTSGQSVDGQTPDRQAALSWNAPLQRQNNESLNMAELAGYVISYGQNPENLDQKIYVNDAYVMEYTVDGLSEGTWYFSVQAEDDNGLMSPPSDLVSKTFQS